MNDFEVLVASVTASFGEAPTRWLLHFPAVANLGDPDDLSWTEGSLAGPDGREPLWHRLTRADAEALTGLDPSSADTEPATVAELTDSEMLRELAVAPEPERLPSEYLQILPVTALPFPHGAFRCPHHDRFRELARVYQDDAERIVAGAHWYLTLAADDSASCPFHQCDWRTGAEASVEELKLPARTSS